MGSKPSKHVKPRNKFDDFDFDDEHREKERSVTRKKQKHDKEALRQIQSTTKKRS